MITAEAYRHKLLKAMTAKSSCALRLLLEKKHLYQNLTIDCADLEEEVKQITNSSLNENAKTFQHIYDTLPLLYWKVLTPLERNRPTSTHGLPAWELYLDIDTIKVFCSKCDRIEAHNLVKCEDLVSNHPTEIRHKEALMIQLLCLSYQCQSCKSLPSFFLIHRSDMKVSQHGRSPMETVAIPRHIPKLARRYYSDAQIAFNSGQTLAGIFFLRVLIEQYSQAYLKKNLLADEAIRAYTAELPSDFKDRFPSLYSIYGLLSECIHEANADTETFEKCLCDISLHFEAKRLFKIEEPVA